MLTPRNTPRTLVPPVRYRGVLYVRRPCVASISLKANRLLSSSPHIRRGSLIRSDRYHGERLTLPHGHLQQHLPPEPLGVRHNISPSSTLLGLNCRIRRNANAQLHITIARTSHFQPPKARRSGIRSCGVVGSSSVGACRSLRHDTRHSLLTLAHFAGCHRRRNSSLL